MTAQPLLAIKGLTTTFRLNDGAVTPVREVDLSIHAGETVALVGESGSGKSVTSLSCMRLLPKANARISSGQIFFRTRDGRQIDLATLDDEAMRLLRGDDIAMVFQEPMTSLNPVYTIGDQIAEPLRIHRGLPRSEAWRQAIHALDMVGIPDSARRAEQYPHEMSGGMRQRAMIAMALACRPSMLIADEPTTALDVTIQAQILDLMRRLQGELGMGILFVTHNLGVVAEMAHRVAVMYAGHIVESGPVRKIFRRPFHPYTAGLLASMPRLGEATAARERGGALPAIPGNVPALRNLPQGCAFAPRCAMAIEECRVAPPPLTRIDESRETRCLRWKELA